MATAMRKRLKPDSILSLFSLIVAVVVVDVVVVFL